MKSLKKMPVLDSWFICMYRGKSKFPSALPKNKTVVTLEKIKRISSPTACQEQWFFSCSSCRGGSEIKWLSCRQVASWGGGEYLVLPK